MDGVLLVNTGSPDSPAIPDVRRYLDEFLVDERVLDYPPLLRRGLVHGFILPRRPVTSATAYRAIWWDEGSPQVISRRVQKVLKEELGMPVIRFSSPHSALYRRRASPTAPTPWPSSRDSAANAGCSRRRRT